MVASNGHCRRVDLPPRHPPIRSERAREVARWFGLTCAAPSPPAEPDVNGLLPAPGQVLLVTGASGAGKSSLLREMRRSAETRRIACLDLGAIHGPDRPLVDCFDGLSLAQVMELLARVGLSEAWTFIRTPAELSDGQRWRLRLALALHATRNAPGSLLICDEFAALLDRVTACVVAHALARLVRAQRRVGAILATSHDDLGVAIEPDVEVRCDFGFASIQTRNPNSRVSATYENKGSNPQNDGESDLQPPTSASTSATTRSIPGRQRSPRG